MQNMLLTVLCCFLYLNKEAVATIPSCCTFSC